MKLTDRHVEYRSGVAGRPRIDSPKRGHLRFAQVISISFA